MLNENLKLLDKKAVTKEKVFKRTIFYIFSFDSSFFLPISKHFTKDFTLFLYVPAHGYFLPLIQETILRFYFPLTFFVIFIITPTDILFNHHSCKQLLQILNTEDFCAPSQAKAFLFLQKRSFPSLKIHCLHQSERN